MNKSQSRKLFEMFLAYQDKEHPNGALSKITMAKMRIASHPNSGSHLLAELSKSSSILVLVRVAENPNTPVAILGRLSEHAHPEVRAAVGENPNTPLPVLELLAKDECGDVRFSLAENHNLPPAILSTLAEDDNPYVACRANRTLKRIGIQASPRAYEKAWINFQKVWRKHG